MKGKNSIILIIALIVVLGGGYWAYTQDMLPIKPSDGGEVGFGGPITDGILNNNDNYVINTEVPNDGYNQDSVSNDSQSYNINDFSGEYVPDASIYQEDILSYTQFIGNGFTFSFPKVWYTEVSEDKNTFVGKSGQYETNRASISVQAGTSSKSLEDFTFAAVQLLWDKGNMVTVYDNKVGSFPAKELRYDNKDEGTTAIQIITVDADVNTAYIMTLKCLTNEVPRYTTVYQDVMGSFKLIDLAEEPELEVEDDVKDNDSLFD